MTPAPTQSPGNTKVTILLLVCLIALLAVSYLFIQVSSKGNQPLFVESLRSKKAEPSPSPNEQRLIVKLPEGKQVYRFSHGKDVKGPKPESITIDPLTPQPGQTQTVSIKVDATTPADIAKVEVISDNKTTTHELRLSNETWQGAWAIDDSFDYKYGFRLILAGAETYEEVMWLKNQQ